MVQETKPGSWRSKGSTSTFCAGPISISRAFKGTPEARTAPGGIFLFTQKALDALAILALIPRVAQYVCGIQSPPRRIT